MLSFIGWVDCVDARIMVSKEDDYFMCIKYVGSQKIADAQKKCASIEELTEFLTSLPNANPLEIEEVISKLD